MIRISRPKSIPSVLRKKGRQLTRADEKQYQRDPQAFRDGSKRFAFDRCVYADASVKAALLAAQHNKCAFCESKPLPVSDGDVEHFRPKAAVQQAVSTPCERPGYYWLAYAWHNLLFSCERCNRRHKKSLFPLVDPQQRARIPTDPIETEQPIFINPAEEDPSAHISFREHVPIARNGSRRGKRTIQALGLDREHLNEARETHLKLLNHIFLLTRLPGIPPEHRTSAEDLLRRMTTDQAEYASMSRIAVATWQAQ